MIKALIFLIDRNARAFLSHANVLYKKVRGISIFVVSGIVLVTTLCRRTALYFLI